MNSYNSILDACILYIDSSNIDIKIKKLKQPLFWDGVHTMSAVRSNGHTDIMNSKHLV